MSTRISGVGISNRGFTLIELTMVLFIIGLTLGLVLPGMDKIFAGDSLRTTVNRVLSGVDQARSQAMLDREPWLLVIDTSQTMEPDEETALDREERTIVLRPDEGTRFRDVVLFRTGGVIEGEMAALAFLPNGLAEPALIHCLAEDGRIQTIYLKSFNPRPVVVSGDKGLEDGFNG
ncbi:prepilin-type N-terminal cleavage/methylation domain-containing protein [Desulfoplanes sp.]